VWLDRGELGKIIERSPRYRSHRGNTNQNHIAKNTEKVEYTMTAAITTIKSARKRTLSAIYLILATNKTTPGGTWSRSATPSPHLCKTSLQELIPLRNAAGISHPQHSFDVS
jgi:hypothetical protein